jgi:hypothetical protein
MIPKNKAPGLNREQRRHPKRYAMTALPKGSGMPWLLMGLLYRGGYMGKVEEPGAFAFPDKPAMPTPPRSPGLLARLAGRVSRWFKG